MAEKCLGRSERFTHFTEKRRVRVPEAVPGDRRQFQRIARRPQDAAKQIFWIEWRLLSSGEHEVFRAGLP